MWGLGGGWGGGGVGWGGGAYSAAAQGWYLDICMCESFITYLLEVGAFLRMLQFPPFHHHPNRRSHMTLAVAEALSQ